MSKHSPSRRAFLQRSAALTLAGAGAPLALNLATMAEAAAQSTGATDYKALVCVFLQGGNDHGNTLIPFDQASYNSYAQARGAAVALARDGLAGTVLPTLASGRQVAMAPALAPLKARMDAGQLAWLLNIGPLVQPTTLAQYKGRSVPLPAKLFSHNDQQSAWQSYGPEGTVAGWGGRAGDLLMANNGRASLTCVNMAGSAVYLAGEQAVPYMLHPNGAPALTALEWGLFGSAACKEAFRTLVTQTSQAHMLAAEHAVVMARAIDVNAQLRSALSGTAAPAAAFDALANPLAAQLKMVAHMIAARQALGVRRQVFFVSLGGFDLHDNLMARHPVLLGQVASAMVSFQAAMDELQVANQVTTFTASDFGRTLSSNGDGSDHGWGGHHMVMGGAVRGGLYGRLPDAGLGGDTDTGQGRLLPTMGVQQLAASLGRWFGVPASDLGLVAPGHGAFDSSTLSALYRV